MPSVDDVVRIALRVLDEIPDDRPILRESVLRGLFLDYGEDVRQTLIDSAPNVVDFGGQAHSL